MYLSSLPEYDVFVTLNHEISTDIVKAREQYKNYLQSVEMIFRRCNLPKLVQNQIFSFMFPDKF